MKKSEYKQAKRLNRQIKSEKAHLRNLEFEYEMGGRRQSHTPAKSRDATEQRMFDELAKANEKNDAAIIKHQKERIATLKQKFADVCESEINKPELEFAFDIQDVISIEKHCINSEIWIVASHTSISLMPGDIVSLISVLHLNALVIDVDKARRRYQVINSIGPIEEMIKALAKHKESNIPVHIHRNPFLLQ